MNLTYEKTIQEFKKHLKLLKKKIEFNEKEFYASINKFLEEWINE